MKEPKIAFAAEKCALLIEEFERSLSIMTTPIIDYKNVNLKFQRLMDEICEMKDYLEGVVEDNSADILPFEKLLRNFPKPAYPWHNGK